MKTLITALFLFAAYTCTHAQRFAPIGAKWHYTVKPTNYFVLPSQPVYEEQYSLVEAVKDTIILNKTCQEIVSTVNMNFFDTVSYYLYSENKVDYIYNRYLDNFQILCDYNAQKGDKWMYIHHWSSKKVTNENDEETNEIDTFEVEVTRAQAITINGVQLARLELKYTLLGQSYFFRGQHETVAIEKLGNKDFFLFPELDMNQGSLIYWRELYVNGLRCYEDADFGQYSTGIAESCTYVRVGLDQVVPNIQLTMYPNPTSDKIWLQTDYDQELTYEMFSFNGQTLAKGTMFLNTEVKLENLPQGVYTIRLSENGMTLKAQSFIKQ